MTSHDAAAQDFITQLTALVKQAVASYIRDEGLNVEVDTLPFDVRPTTQASFGDYAMPAMPWSAKRSLGRPPMVIAEALATRLRAMKPPIIREVTVAAPGFLNIALDRPEVGSEIIARIQEAGDNFGQSDVGAGTKIIIEHTNINSNKAAHVGHLRNSCIGDTVARALRSQGYQVEVENYIDDTGVQVADVVIGLTLLERGELEIEGGPEQLPDESFDYYCSRVYVATGKAYEAHPELLEMRRAVLHGIEANAAATTGEPDYASRAAELSTKIVKAHLGTMSRLNVFYDLLTWESAILNAGPLARTFEMLRDSGVLRKPDSGPAKDCWILPFGDGETTTDEGNRSADKML